MEGKEKTRTFSAADAAFALNHPGREDAWAFVALVVAGQEGFGCGLGDCVCEC